MITAVQSLAFDIIRAIDEPSPAKALEESIKVACQRIKTYSELNAPKRIPDILRDALSIDMIEQKSKPDIFVFSEDRVRELHDGTAKEAVAYEKVTHGVLTKLKHRILGRDGYD